MLKIASLALATVIGATTLIPSMASAIDNGPCDHCTMDPIVVKGDRPDKEKSQTATKKIKASQPATVVIVTPK